MHRLLAAFVSLVLVMPPVAAAALDAGAEVPPFGPSITIDPDGPSFSLESLRGKVIVIVFFQSWCGICNGWSQELFQQIEEAYGDDWGYALLAIKTDGSSSITSARAYLSQRQIHLDRWLLAVDADAAFYKSVSGDDALYGYAVIGPDGRLLEQGKAGRFRRVNGKKTYALALPETKTAYDGKTGSRTTFLPPGDGYDRALHAVVRNAEVGDLVAAYRVLAQHTRLPQADSLRQDLDTAVADRAQALVDAADAADSPHKRMEALVALERLLTGIERLPAVSSAAQTLRDHRRDRALRQEWRSWDAWRRVLAQADALEPQHRQRALAQVVPRFIAANADTYAAAEAAAYLP